MSNGANNIVNWARQVKEADRELDEAMEKVVKSKGSEETVKELEVAAQKYESLTGLRMPGLPPRMPRT